LNQQTMPDPLSDNGPTASAEGDIFGFVDAPEGYEIELIEKARMVCEGCPRQTRVRIRAIADAG
jgi:hypothetical protein